MEVCRIDDADRLHVTYRKKTTGVSAACTVVIAVILIAGLTAYGFISMADGNGGMALLVMVLLMALALVLTALKIIRNDAYFMAYVIDGNAVYRIDIPKACTNDRLFGSAVPFFSIGALAAKNHMLSNMKKLPTASYIDEFVCNRQVAEYSGSVIDKVFSVNEGKKYLKVRAQLMFINKQAHFFPSRRQTLYIPKTFANIDKLSYCLEYLR